MLDIGDRIWRWATEIDIWLGVSVCVSAILAVCCIYLYESRSREKQMARRKYEESVSDILELALRNAVVEGKIPQKFYVQFCREAGHKLGFRSLIPVERPQLTQFPDGRWRHMPKVRLASLRSQAWKRLLALGFSVEDIKGWLKRDPKKPAELLAKLKRKH